MSSKRGMTASPGEIEWHCPFCNTTEPTLREIQNHITESVDGEHEGVSGESPDEDIVAIDPESGDEIDRYKGTDVVRPENQPLEDASKRKQVVAAWLAASREDNPDLISAVTEANREYSQQILGQIRRGEIDQDYWVDIDPALRQAMEDRLDEYDPDESNESDSDMSTQEEGEQDTDVSGVSSKDIVLNTLSLAGDDVNRKQAWQALTDAGVFDSGYEYFRRTFKEGVDGEHDVSAATDEQLRSVIAPVLDQAGVLTDGPDSAGEELEQEQEDTSSDAAATSASASGTSRQTGSVGVSVEELRELRDRVDMLKRQVEFESEGGDSPEFRKAKFIAEETLDGLDELIN